MIRELIEAGGPGALVPVVFAAGVMYLANWLLGLEHRRSERRRQFLELWPKRLENDELWSQVALRHLTGEYLPQSLVNVVMTQSDKALGLIELASVWDYLTLTPGNTPQLRWKRQWNEHPYRRRLSRVAFNLSYFVVSWIAAWLLLGAARAPLTPLTWLWGFGGLAAGLTAFLLLVQDHRLKTASDVAPRWILRINVKPDTARVIPLGAVSTPVPAALP